MNNIPTAEELLLEIMGCLKMDYSLKELNEFDSDLVPFLVEQINNRTKLHVEPALKAAAEKATAEIELGNPYDPESGYPIVNQQSILNAYPLNLIK